MDFFRKYRNQKLKQKLMAKYNCNENDMKRDSLTKCRTDYDEQKEYKTINDKNLNKRKILEQKNGEYFEGGKSKRSRKSRRFRKTKRSRKTRRR